MIPEAFLIGALALPAVGYTYGGSPKVDPTSFGKLLARERTKFLAVSGDPIVVSNLRRANMNAFGALTEDRPGATQWHIVTEAWSIGFKTSTFATVLWRHSNPSQAIRYPELLEATRLVEPLGRLIYMDNDYPYWDHWLLKWGWKRLFEIGIDRMVGYQKPYDGDYNYDRDLSDLEPWQRPKSLRSSS